SCVVCPGFAWPGWGLTTTTPDNQIALLRQLVTPGSQLTRAAREYALSLTEDVTRAGVDTRDEPAESQHPLQRLRAIPDDGLAAAAQLAQAEPPLGRDVPGPRVRVAQQASRPGYSGVRRTVGDQGRRHVKHPVRGDLRVQRGGQPPGVGRPQVGQV